MHALAPEAVAARYPRLGDFRDLVRRHDPDGRFANDYLKRYVLATRS